MDAQPGDEPQGDPAGDQEDLPQNETPFVLMRAIDTVVWTLQDYGWFVLLGFAVFIYAFVKLKPYFQQRQRDQADAAYYKKYDAGVVLQRQQDMEAARQRLQAEHDAQAAAFAARQRQREEKKKQERFEDWDRHQQGLGYRSKVKSQEEPNPGPHGPKPKPKPRLRDDNFNPLSGAGGASYYRPAPRGGAGGG